MPRVASRELDQERWAQAWRMAAERLKMPPRGKRGSEANHRRMMLSGKVHYLALQIYEKELGHPHNGC